MYLGRPVKVCICPLMKGSQAVVSCSLTSLVHVPASSCIASPQIDKRETVAGRNVWDVQRKHLYQLKIGYCIARSASVLRFFPRCIRCTASTTKVPE